MTAPISDLPARRWFVLAFLGVVVVGAGCIGGLDNLYDGFESPPTWERIETRIAMDFPGVRHLTTAELADRIGEGRETVLIDSRPEEEFSVSHLKGARRAETVEEVRKLAGLGEEIVVYCSVGARSASLVAELQKAGFRTVWNLRGSIFRWAKEGRPLVDSEGEATTRVHPYNARWGALLDARIPRPAQ